ncbi:MAG: D-alanyl-D-alanine carboxypeptidase [Roseburia sp.]|nr:D-alanyl-D-alanine carboxypeptidase [Roseburia sp.]
MKLGKRIGSLLLCLLLVLSLDVTVSAQVTITAASAILMEASTGQVIFEQDASVRRSPASITKIMTLLLTMEQIEAGKVSLEDEVLVSEYASSMGGSQVYLAQGEVQTLDTMLKCITVASGNDASVAVAEHIAGSEAAFVDMMNERALELGMLDTHFLDCCGLTDEDEHYTTARDVAIMSRELITKHPKIYDYTKIWMEDITHVTKQGTSIFGLSSTNKLLKQYQWTTGLKTGSTSKAKYCISATASKDGVDLIAVVMGASDPRVRFSEAQTLLTYGFGCCRLYVDENREPLAEMPVAKGTKETVPIAYEGEFRYLDTGDRDLSKVERRVELPEKVEAPITAGDTVGKVHYLIDGEELGSISILYGEDVPKAGYRDYLIRTLDIFLL